MRNAGHNSQEFSLGKQNQAVGAQGQAEYPLEAIIALQKALEEGLPEHETGSTEGRDGVELAGQPDCNEDVGPWEQPVRLLLNPLSLFLKEVRQLVSAAAQSYCSGSEARQSIAGSGAPWP